MDVYILYKNLIIENLKLQTEEVSEVKWFSISEFEEMVNGHDTNLVEHKEMHEKIIRYLKEKFNIS